MDETPLHSEQPAVVPKPRAAKFTVSNRMLALLFVGAIALGSAYGYRGLFIAATVDGSPISRIAVIQKLEQQNGKNILDALVTDRLIQTAAARLSITVDPSEIDAEIEKITAQIKAQGLTLDDVLRQEGLTLSEVRQQIATREQLRKILGDSLVVTDEEIDDYLSKTKLSPPKEIPESDFREDIRRQLSDQKFGTEAEKWIASAREAADIQYFAGYAKPDGKANAIAPDETPAP
ncbi:MAG: hypothetical protein E6Q06_04630 [Candidatus Moraniibacteriota bacterium]|nr:MAG: hypothetical protein E6Q06_04630 [Candidatus Moranbacteria bacterium]